jgi:nucleoside recognition membrane protein YjiH
VLGLGFFAVPVPWNGRWTVAFDIVVKELRTGFAGPVAAYCAVLIVAGAVATCLASFRRGDYPKLKAFEAAPVLAALRVLGVPLAIMFWLGLGPAALHEKAIGGTIWGVLVLSVGLIIPIGAVALNVFISYGALELVGTLTRPLMRPLFRLPGRAALDDITSWLGSYSVGLYLTRKLVDQGRYTRREAFIIVTGFSTVSIGFVGVVCSTLELLHLFPVVFATYFVVIYLIAAIQCRVWPTTGILDEAITTHQPEGEPEGPLLAAAWKAAIDRAKEARPLPHVAAEGFRDGLILAATILGTILAVGTGALMLAEHTPLLDWLGRPLVPVITALGIPDAELVATATVAGITEMYIPALIVQDASAPARFFIAVLSISQLIFFSSVGPMMLDMFSDLPIRVRDLLALFVFRTALLLPMLALVTHALVWAGML